MAENNTSGERQQVGGCSAAISEPAAYGISGLWRRTYLHNLDESAIRPFMVGKKNWLFCDSVKGTEASAIVYSLVETAKADEVSLTNI